MTFQLDTSGIVSGPFNATGYLTFDDLDPFTQGYVEADMRSLYEASAGDPRIIAALNGASYIGPGFSDLAPETLARIIEDCAASIELRLPSLREEVRHDRHQGRFLWEDRQKGKRTGFPPLTAYLGDDGKVYLR